jgi:Na+/melibiose symporter-like transporter
VALSFRPFVHRLTEQFRETFLSRGEMGVARRYIVLSSYTLGIASTCANAFMTPFYLMLGADNAFIGLLSVIPTAGNMLQVFSATFLERFPKRRKILIGSRIANYTLNIVAIGLIPYIGGPNTLRLSFLLAISFLMTVMTAMTSPGFSIWQIKNIPQEIRSNFVSFQTALYMVMITPVSLGVSRIIDRFIAKDAGAGHAHFLAGTAVLRAVAVVFAAYDVFCLLRIKEQPNEVPVKAPSLVESLIAPLREKRYLVNVAMVALYTFPGAFYGSYYSFYLYQNLKLDLTTIATFSALSAPLSFIFYPLWGRIITRIHYYRALYIVLPLSVAQCVAAAFTTKDNYLVFYSLSMLLGTVGGPGASIAFYNIQFDSLPKANQTNFIGFWSTVSSAVAMVSALLGREFMKFTSSLTADGTGGSGIFARTADGLTIRLLGVQMINRQYILLVVAILIVATTAVIFRLLSRIGVQWENPLQGRQKGG